MGYYILQSRYGQPPKDIICYSHVVGWEPIKAHEVFCVMVTLPRFPEFGEALGPCGFDVPLALRDQENLLNIGTNSWNCCAISDQWAKCPNQPGRFLIRRTPNSQAEMPIYFCSSQEFPPDNAVSVPPRRYFWLQGSRRIGGPHRSTSALAVSATDRWVMMTTRCDPQWEWWPKIETGSPTFFVSSKWGMAQHFSMTEATRIGPRIVSQPWGKGSQALNPWSCWMEYSQIIPLVNPMVSHCTQGFPEIGLPPVIIRLQLGLSLEYTNQRAWGTPMTMETPIHGTPDS